MGSIAMAQAATPAADTVAPTEATTPGGPIRLRQTLGPRADEHPATEAAPPVPYAPGEFERFVQRQAGAGIEVRRLGAELLTGGTDSRYGELNQQVPSDYVLAPGDEVLVTLWGSVDADLRLIVDRSGRISIPRIGPIQVGGVRSDELQATVSRRVAQVFKNFQISVTLGQLRPIKVFATGYVVRPGMHTVGSLSSVLSVLMRAGGPTAAGSFRQVELRRNGRLLSSFDLYDLLVKGDRSSDSLVQAGDVVHVGPVGPQVGFIGSVNKPTVLEMKPGETVAEALRFAGGFSAVADRSRLTVERLQARSTYRVELLQLPSDLAQTLGPGDVLQAFSAVDIASPSQHRSKRVRIEGEVLRPSEYVLPESSTIADALRMAGGLTANAYLFATEFTRESVRQYQQENYDRALRDLETDFVRTAGSTRPSGPEETASDVARTTGTNRLIDRLRALRPNGRVILQLPPDATDLPPLALEDGDRIFVPARPTTVGIFGSVFNAGSYLFSPGRTLDEYLRLAGGPTKGADESSIFVVRANGNVVSNRQDSTWWSKKNSVGMSRAEPGDTVFVPEEMNKTTFIQSAKDWTQILYQFGIGLAGIKSAVQ